MSATVVFVVERARPEDLDAVIRLSARVFPEEYQDTFFSAMLEVAGETFLVARDIGTMRFLGFALATRSTTAEARLLLLATVPDQRGKGLGGRLLRETEARLRRKGCLGVFLEVREDNLPGIRFYHRHGYEITGSVSGFYQDGSKAVVMQKGL
ncbi:MAG: GNAT family N-acetyltransferase [Euryarchaeota archaeon]|nr:GNAT family N-acetyltransferase [Euryarchaeota archaeon]